jgi:hypothetical protein
MLAVEKLSLKISVAEASTSGDLIEAQVQNRLDSAQDEVNTGNSGTNRKTPIATEPIAVVRRYLSFRNVLPWPSNLNSQNV